MKARNGTLVWLIARDLLLILLLRAERESTILVKLVLLFNDWIDASVSNLILSLRNYSRFDFRWKLTEHSTNGIHGRRTQMRQLLPGLLLADGQAS